MSWFWTITMARRLATKPLVLSRSATTVSTMAATANAVLAAGGHCGDGIVQGNEECDDGPNNGKGSCMQDCTFGIVS
jgi:hypothetical protein